MAMQPLLNTPLIAAPAHLNHLAVFGGAHRWTWRQIHSAALTLAAQIDPSSTLYNLCNSRAGFFIVWLAALRRGCVQVLPPSGGQTDLVTMLRTQTQPVIVVDDAQALQPYWATHARCMVYAPELQGHGQDDAQLAWTPDTDAPLVHLYTSGSTGRPESHTKNLMQLAQGARVLGERLDQSLDGGLAAVRQLVCSVPQQHMFGLETSVMLPLIYGMAVFEQRPLLPADVRAAFESNTQDAAWIATPLHLRALVQAGETVPHCRAVITSTMPLATTLAVQTEARVQAPVLEIYGSTETGALALRRTAQTSAWRALAGVKLAGVKFEPATQDSPASGTQVWGTHFTSPQRLADQIAPDAQGGFTLLGRDADLIKIAGRRASLAGLNLLLHDLPGLTDGVFYLPATGEPTQRLVLIYAGAPLERAATEAWLRLRMDPTFLPRALIHVAHLPRTPAGKLPRAALDEIYAAWLAQRVPQTKVPGDAMNLIAFDLRVPADHPSLPGHFPGRPIVPGVVLLDGVVAPLEAATGRRVAQVQQVKFTSALQPEEHAHARCEVRGNAVSFSVIAQREGVTVTLALGKLTLHPQDGLAP